VRIRGKNAQGISAKEPPSADSHWYLLPGAGDNSQEAGNPVRAYALQPHFIVGVQLDVFPGLHDVHARPKPDLVLTDPAWPNRAPG
jgi:hypothetical protein